MKCGGNKNSRVDLTYQSVKFPQTDYKYTKVSLPNKNYYPIHGFRKTPNKDYIHFKGLKDLVV